MHMDRISRIDMDEDLKRRYIGELRCGRGFLALLLYDFYGPVTLVPLEVLKNPLEETILPRATEAEMQQFIVENLTEAAKVLPYNYRKGDSNYGLSTKCLCNFLLLKFYMQTRQWSEAENIGRELLKSEYGYDLVQTSYKDIFTLANEKNVETIWAKNCIDGFNEDIWIPTALPSDYSTSTNTEKWGMLRLSWHFVHTFEEGDNRMETIITEYTGTTGIVHNETNDAITSGIMRLGAIPIKYEIDATTTGYDRQIDFIIYQYADALTLLAEAIVRNENAVTGEAIDLLNRVRTRAGLQAYTMSSFTGPRDFLDKLLMKRAHEFWFEHGIRRQDLIRDGSYIERMRYVASLYGISQDFIQDYMTRFAIPQGAINESKGIVTQNPGY